MPYVVAVLMSVLGVVGDYFLKLASADALQVNVKLLALGVLIYAATALGWFYALAHLKLAVVGVVYSVSTVLLLTLLGALYFREHLSYMEILGLILAILSLILLARFA